jgi:hypothetical protein
MRILGMAGERKPRKLSPDTIDQFEKETIALVIKSLPEIEKNLASWDGLRHKPENLRDKFEKYRLLQEALSEWARKTLTSSGRGENFTDRVDRLWEFVFLCRELKKVD